MTPIELEEPIGAVHTALARREEDLNELNVYPVPDGDTGTNMLRTIEAVREEVSQNTYHSPQEAARAVTHSALMGARGNAGVILSQILRGAADVLAGAEALTPNLAAKALIAAGERAYEAVNDPQEGTILTVIREAADAGQRAAEEGEDPTGVIRAARDEAYASVERTPQLLEALRQAGVVDAGGLGVAVALDGLYAYLSGEELEYAEVPTSTPPDLASMVHTGEENRGYCTQFVVTDFEGDARSFEEHIRSMGYSVLVVPAADLVRVHLHTQDPGEPLSYAANFGRLSDVSIEDMEAQVRARTEEPPAALGLVAVASGEGIRGLFERAGAIVVEGGQSQNPDVSELAEGVNRARAGHVILLPNNKNIVPAAERVGDLVEMSVHVIPTHNMAAGLALTVEFDPERAPQEAERAMKTALSEMRHPEITRSTRQATVEGHEVPEGAYMGFLDGELAVVGGSIEEAILSLATRLAKEEAELLTVLYGEGLDEKEAREISKRIEELGLEVELHHGGQPLYPLLICAE